MKRKKSLIRRIAILLASHAANALPTKRENWARAMSSEVDHIAEDGVALRWAIGCLFTSYLERMVDMNRSNLQVSRAFLSFEMLLCFGIPCMAFVATIFQIGNFGTRSWAPFSMLVFTSWLIGPIGLVFAFRNIAFKRNTLGRSVVTVLVLLVTWTLIANGILMWIAADLPYMSWGWSGIFIGAILPALGVAHLIYISNTEQQMEIPT